MMSQQCYIAILTRSTYPYLDPLDCWEDRQTFPVDIGNAILYHPGICTFESSINLTDNCHVINFVCLPIIKSLPGEFSMIFINS